MARHKLMPYEMQIREKRNTRDYTDLQSLLSTNNFETTYEGDSDAPQTFIELFKNYCDEWRENEGAHINQDKQKTFRISQDNEELCVDHNNNLIEGIIRSGNYGQQYRIYDTESGEEQSESIDVDEAPDTPFYFLIHVPDAEPRTARLVIEQSGNIGVLGMFQESLSSKLPNGILHEMTQATDSALYDAIRNASRVKRLTIEQSESPHEISDQFDRVFGTSSTTKTSTYSAVDEGSIDIDVSELQEWFESEDRPLEDVDGASYTDFRITVESTGSQTTLDIQEGEIKKNRIIDVAEQDGGHPLPNRMAIQARQFVNQDLLPAGAASIPQHSPLRG